MRLYESLQISPTRALTVVYPLGFAVIQGRPCRRCIKRNIPNLCHDEPREPAKRIKTETEGGHSTDEETGVSLTANNDFTTTAPLNQPAEPGRQVLPDNGTSATLGITPSSSSSSRPLPEGSQALQQPTAGTAALGQDLDGNTQSRKAPLLLFPILIPQFPMEAQPSPAYPKPDPACGSPYDDIQ